MTTTNESADPSSHLTEAERAERVTLDFQRQEILVALGRAALTPEQIATRTGLTLAVVAGMLRTLREYGEVEDAGGGKVRAASTRATTRQGRSQGARA